MRFDKMHDLFNKTNRNVICYYSAWLQGNIASPNPEVMIYDNDMNGFMNAVSQLDKSKGLVHTPGGVTTATENIVNYLRKIFNYDIRVVVPHMATIPFELLNSLSMVFFLARNCFIPYGC